MENWASRWDHLRTSMAKAVAHPGVVLALPAVMLALYWIGGETLLMAGAATFPVLFWVLGNGVALRGKGKRTHLKGTMTRTAFRAAVDDVYEAVRDGDVKSAMFHIKLDEFEKVVDRHGDAAAETILRRTNDRIASTLRDGDFVCQTSDSCFTVCLGPTLQIDLEACIQLAGRIQNIIEEPVSIDGISVYVTGAIGFCLSGRAPGNSGAQWAEAATIALREAQKRGPTAIRAFTEEMKRVVRNQTELQADVTKGLEVGQITPWYQPQISTDTGKVTGFEALARWHHPERGMISPGDFLPAIEAAGLLERLSEVMLYHTLTAMKAWDAAGVFVPQVGVNFSAVELNNPNLVEKIKWELDRFDLSPHRLSIEVLETVIAGDPDDVITRNLNGLIALGCRVDLDDFGTGHASISSIRRFSISRIKIDRSFVMKADRDPDQQRMIGAILTMAERLGMETLAEGVETVGEHALLAQLGCDHVQGFGIGKPMPFHDTLDWISRHEAKLQDAPKITNGRPN